MPSRGFSVEGRVEGGVNWESLLDQVAQLVEGGDLKGAVSVVEQLFRSRSEWRQRGREGVERWVERYCAKRGVKVSFEGLLNRLISGEVYSLAYSIAEELGYPPSFAHYAASFAVAGAAAVRSGLRWGGVEGVRESLKLVVLRGVRKAGFSEVEAKRWVHLGAAVASYFLLNPRRLEKEAAALLEGVKGYVE